MVCHDNAWKCLQICKLNGRSCGLFYHCKNKPPRNSICPLSSAEQDGVCPIFIVLMIWVYKSTYYVIFLTNSRRLRAKMYIVFDPLFRYGVCWDRSEEREFDRSTVQDSRGSGQRHKQERAGMLISCSSLHVFTMLHAFLICHGSRCSCMKVETRIICCFLQYQVCT